MGSTHRAARSRIATAQAQSAVRGAELQRQNREEQLRIGERFLGTDAQVSGTLGGPSEAETPYAARVSVDRELAYQIGVNSIDTPGTPALIERTEKQINDLLTQAQEAARLGDIESADRLKSEADSLISTNPNLYRLLADPEQQAFSQLSSPLAQTVGGLVRQGREFLDPSSATSQQFKSSLTTNAQREIAAGERDALRGSRDIGLSRGAGRNPYSERAVDARTRERFSTQSASVETEAARFFESFSRAFSADTVTLGQAFLQNQSGVREQFQGALDSLALASAELSNQAASRFEAARARSEAGDEARKAFQRELTLEGLGLLSAVAGSAGGGGGAAAAGQAAGAGAGLGAVPGLGDLF